jgi:DNA-directed RNA polymerase omega subunit
MSHLILPKNVDSKFRFITVASQRAKQLQNGAKPRVEAKSRKPTRIAMQEVLAEAVSWEIRDEKEMAAAAAEAAAAAAAAAKEA